MTMLNNSGTIGHFWHLDVLKMGVRPRFDLSKVRCLYDDRIDDNRVAAVGCQPDEFNRIPHRRRLKRWALARLLEPKNKPATEGGLFDADQTRSMPKMGDFNYDCFNLRTLGR